MQIPSYQIQNVLKVYSRQLSQGKMLSKSKLGSYGNVYADSVTISSEGKRQGIINKVAASIVERITTEGPKAHNDEQITGQIEKELGKKIDFTKGKKQFTYTTVDENDNMVVKTLSVEDSQFVVRRMTELARKVADDNMVS